MKFPKRFHLFLRYFIISVICIFTMATVLSVSPLVKYNEIVGNIASYDAQIQIENNNIGLDATSKPEYDDITTEESAVNLDSMIDFKSAPPIPVPSEILSSAKCGPFIYAAMEEMFANQKSNNGPPLFPSNLPFLTLDNEGFPLQMDCTRHANLLGDDEHHYWPCRPPRTYKRNSWPSYHLPHTGSSKLANLLEDRSMTENDENMEFLRQQYEEQKRRTTRIAETCEKNPILYGRKSHEISWILNRDPKIVYCPFYKSASCTWMMNLVHLATKEEQESVKDIEAPHLKVRTIFPTPHRSNIVQTFNESLRFIVIRHPFIRFLSAYRDKIGRTDPFPHEIYFKQLQRAILYKYRPQNSGIPLPYPTFSEFVDYFIDFTKNLHTLHDWDQKVMEWLPYWVQCSICSSDYQMIIKLETLESDKQFLIDIANLDELKGLDTWENQRENKSSNFIADSFYNQLTISQMENLKKSYGPDFEMFEYDIEEFLPFAKDYSQAQI